MQNISCMNIGGGNRIGYIDAMRGFSMILVVFGHVLLMMGFPTDSTILGTILLTFRMPLFFFVSGFFAYRAMERWSVQMAKSILKRKIQAQVICTIVFYSLFQFCHGKSPLLFLTQSFSWFWFTIVLFQMFLIYMVLAIAENILKRHAIVTVGLIVLSVAFFIIYVRFPNTKFQLWDALSWYYLVEYFQFFAIGILAKKYYGRFEAILQSDTFRTGTIICYVAALFAAYGFDHALENYNSAVCNIFKMLIVRYAGLFTVFVLFFNNQTYFSGDSKPCRWLKFVGTRTLDIYMLHVFVLPNLLFLNPLLSGSGMLLAQLTIGLAVAILNISVCLFLSTILRTSNTLSQWLFGEKSKAALAS